MIKRYTRKNRRKFSLKVHLIFVTKYRRPILIAGLDTCVKDKITELCLKHEWEIVAMETDRDHIHLLLNYDATERVSDIVHCIKQKPHGSYGKSSTIFCVLGIGRSTYFGLMGILLVVLEKFLPKLLDIT